MSGQTIAVIIIFILAVIGGAWLFWKKFRGAGLCCGMGMDEINKTKSGSGCAGCGGKSENCRC